MTIGKGKFLVLIDFSDTSLAALRYTIKLAKIVQGEIFLCHVVGMLNDDFSNEHQVTNQNSEYTKDKASKMLESILEMIATEGITANYHSEVGDKKSIIQHQINEYKPTLIVVGKADKNPDSNNQITKFLIDECKGHLLVVGHEGEFNKNTNIAIAFDGLLIQESKLKIATDLAQFSFAPLTLVNIGNHDHGHNHSSEEVQWTYSGLKNIKVEHYKTTDIEKGLLEYASNKAPQLLCIGRNIKRQNWFDQFKRKSSFLSEVVNKITIPVLVIN